MQCVAYFHAVLLESARGLEQAVKQRDVLTCADVVAALRSYFHRTEQAPSRTATSKTHILWLDEALVSNAIAEGASFDYFAGLVGHVRSYRSFRLAKGELSVALLSGDQARKVLGNDVAEGRVRKTRSRRGPDHGSLLKRKKLLGSFKLGKQARRKLQLLHSVLDSARQA